MRRRSSKKSNEMRRKSLIAINDPSSLGSESYRMFRTNLNYMNIDSKLKVIMFASAGIKEGKTTSIANCAVTMAFSGKKVLLIDCDLRRGEMHNVFGFKRVPGLTNCLAEKLHYNEVLNQVCAFENLHVITSGLFSPHPADVLSSIAFEQLINEVKEVYDYILIDSAPMLIVADAAAACKVVDGVVLVAAANETKKEDLKKAQNALAKLDARILGVLLTKADVPDKQKYYAYQAAKKK